MIPGTRLKSKVHISLDQFPVLPMKFYNKEATKWLGAPGCEDVLSSGEDLSTGPYYSTREFFEDALLNL